MNLGGPVWHASVAEFATSLSTGQLAAYARAALDGVGDAGRGSWEGMGTAYHLRRRLSAWEQKEVGAVVDVRGSLEAQLRLAPVRALLPAGWPELAEI